MDVLNSLFTKADSEGLLLPLHSTGQRLSLYTDDVALLFSARRSRSTAHKKPTTNFWRSIGPANQLAEELCNSYALWGRDCGNCQYLFAMHNIQFPYYLLGAAHI